MNKKWTTEDGEVVEVTEEMFSQMRPLRDYPEMLAKLEAASRALRGRPKGHSKTSITMRVDVELADALRSSGKGWQTRVNTTLRQAYLPQHPSA